MVGVEDLQDRAPLLEEMLEEENRLFVHRRAKLRVKRRKQLLIFLIELVKVPHQEPLGGKLARKPPNPFIAEEAKGLCPKHSRLEKPS